MCVLSVGFSVMNDVCTPLRSLLAVPHLSALMFIKIVGPPLMAWNPLPYIKAWLAKDRRDATSLHGMTRAMDVPQPGSVSESMEHFVDCVGVGLLLPVLLHDKTFSLHRICLLYTSDAADE